MTEAEKTQLRLLTVVLARMRRWKMCVRGSLDHSLMYAPTDLQEIQAEQMMMRSQDRGIEIHEGTACSSTQHRSLWVMSSLRQNQIAFDERCVSTASSLVERVSQ